MDPRYPIGTFEMPAPVTLSRRQQAIDELAATPAKLRDAANGLSASQLDTPYREEAQKIVAALVDSYINYQSKQRHSSAAERMTVLQQEKEKRQTELGRKQFELQLFRAQHGLIASNLSFWGWMSLIWVITPELLRTIRAQNSVAPWKQRLAMVWAPSTPIAWSMVIL